MPLLYAKCRNTPYTQQEQLRVINLERTDTLVICNSATDVYTFSCVGYPRLCLLPASKIELGLVGVNIRKRKLHYEAQYIVQLELPIAGCDIGPIFFYYLLLGRYMPKHYIHQEVLLRMQIIETLVRDLLVVSSNHTIDALCYAAQRA